MKLIVIFSLAAYVPREASLIAININKMFLVLVRFSRLQVESIGSVSRLFPNCFVDPIHVPWHFKKWNTLTDRPFLWMVRLVDLRAGSTKSIFFV